MTTSQARKKSPPASGTTVERRFDTVALVLQGGGALGSYQAGVVEGLMEMGIEPDWVAGISIGAINSAIIAGNPPKERLQKLRAFWETVCQPATPFLSADILRNMIELGGVASRKMFSGFEAWRSAIEGKQGFFAPRGIMPWLGLPQAADIVSFYSIDQLRSTLERFVDFDRINAGEMRVSVAAVDVQNGNFTYFDNTRGPTKGRMRPEHFMASGALPPGFPAVEIDGRYYWDGGLVSNTPLSAVLQDTPKRNTLAIQVDLWSATGPLPETILDAQERMKDIQYSSRTRIITDTMKQEQKNRRMLRELLELIPEAERQNNAWCQRAAELANAHQYGVIHLIYRDKEWEGHAKDYEFSELTMLDHWSAGLADLRRASAHPEWFAPDPTGREFVTHDANREN